MDEITDSALDLISGVPDPIKKNFLKAVGQLCTAAVDVPVAYLEGKSKELRAETNARISMIKESGMQIAEKMNVTPEYANAAVQKFGERILKQQVNIDSIAKVAADEIISRSILDGNSGEAVTESISEDWLSTFEKEACLKSSDEMKKLFGKILAGEISKPNTFSIKTLKILGNLDKKIAITFLKLCSLTLSIRVGKAIIDARVISFDGDPGTNALRPYGVSFSDLNMLEEYGLIIPQYNTTMNYEMALAINENLRRNVVFNNKLYNFTSLNENGDFQNMTLNGVALSLSGKELLGIVDIVPNQLYTENFLAYLKKVNCNLSEIPT